MRNRADSLGLVMAALVAGCAVLLATIPTAGAGEAAEGKAVPRIEFEETVFDFGTMYQYQEVEHAFKFRNVGSAPLKIEKVKSTCGCTAAIPRDLQLGPGEETTLDVTFQTASYRDRVAKHVFVYSNDPVQPRFALTIEGEVLVEINVVPRGVYVRNLEVGDTIQRHVEITPEAAKQFRILSTESDSPVVRAGDPIPLSDDRPGYKLPIEIGPVHEPGRLRGEIKVGTDLEHTKEIRIAVYIKAVATERDDAAPKAR